MTNTKPNNVFAERDALQRENERLQAENAKLRGCLKYAESNVDALAHAAEIANEAMATMEAELEAARKVADAAVAWFACKYDGDEEATTYAALLRAVNEYRREYRARAESPPLEARIAKACDKLDELEAKQ